MALCPTSALSAHGTLSIHSFWSAHGLRSTSFWCCTWYFVKPVFDFNSVFNNLIAVFHAIVLSKPIQP